MAFLAVKDAGTDAIFKLTILLKGLVQTLDVSCAEPNANELKQRT